MQIAIGGIPVLLLTPLTLGRDSSAAESLVAPPATIQRRRFVLASVVLALLASLAVGIFEVGFNLFGGQTLGLLVGRWRSGSPPALWRSSSIG